MSHISDENHAIEVIQEQISELRDELRNRFDRAFSWLSTDTSTGDLSEAIETLKDEALFEKIERLRALATARLHLEFEVAKKAKKTA
jgi:hypothetical protein